MADIAMVFRWQLSELSELDVDELMQWRDKAITRWNQINNPEED
ncbi:GpE family phage tail protein [Pseudoalteromonas sp. MMG013]|nr:GpE family phage tail protein [Pseudoalteromonas sp. MMG013]MBQ4864594.1 GpE family phage tail protein [Pseudoalteromonas sp. MMG013]